MSHTEVIVSTIFVCQNTVNVLDYTLFGSGLSQGTQRVFTGDLSLRYKKNDVPRKSKIINLYLSKQDVYWNVCINYTEVPLGYFSY